MVKILQFSESFNISPEDNKNILRNIGRTMPVVMEESKVFIPPEPGIMPHAIVPPRGLIGMEHIGGPYFFTQVFINQLPPFRCLSVEPDSGSGNERQAEQITEQIGRFTI